MTKDRGKEAVMMIGLLTLGLSGTANAQHVRPDHVDKSMATEERVSARPAVRQADGEVVAEPPFAETWSSPFSIAETNEVAAFRFDLEGNLLVLANSSDGQTSFVAKIKGTSNSSGSQEWRVDLTLALNTSMEVDLDGNVYVGGIAVDLVSGNGFDALTKITPQGNVLWTRLHGAGDTIGNKLIWDIAIDTDGAIFTASIDGTIRSVDPLTGIVAWSTDLTDTAVQNCLALSGFDDSNIVVDRDGGLYVLVPDDQNDNTLLVRLDSNTGETVWDGACRLVPTNVETAGNEGLNEPMAIDRDGNVYVAGARGKDGVVDKINGDTGDVIWSQVIPAAFLDFGGGAPDIRLDHVKVDGSGRAFAAGESHLPGSADAQITVDAPIAAGPFDGDDNNLYVNIYPDGSQNIDGRRDRISQLALDRQGNLYMNAQTFGFSYGEQVRTIKVDPAGLAIVAVGGEYWTHLRSSDLEGLADTSANGLGVDAGGNVYVGHILEQQAGARSLEVTKLNQPFDGALFSVQSASANLTFEDQSIWAPGAGWLEESTELFTQSWGPNLGFNFSTGFWIPFLGDFGGLAKFLTSGTLTAGVKAEVNGGSVDVDLPFDIEFTIPPANNIKPGEVVTIPVAWTPDPAARMTSCFTPTFNAGLTAAVDYDICARASLTAFSNTLFNTTFVDVSRSLPEDYVPGLNLLDILAQAGLPVPGEWSSIDLPPKGLFTAEFRTPQMFAQSSYNSSTHRFDTDTRDRFFRFGISVTEALLKTVGATAQFDFEVPPPETDGGPKPKKCVGGSNNGKQCTSNANCPDGSCQQKDDNFDGSDFLDFGLGASAELLQLIARVDMGARQRINVGVVPEVEYRVMHAGALWQTVGPQPITQDLIVTTPPQGTFNGRLDIIPTIKNTSADFGNRTDVEIFPGIKWKTLDLALSAAAFGFEILSFNQCFLCFDWDVSEILEALGVQDASIVNPSIRVFPTVFNNNRECVGGTNAGGSCSVDADCPSGACFGSWNIPFQDQKLPCFRVLGETTTQPRLVAASRESLSMVIYDQTSPRISSFNVATFGGTKMLLYGERLTATSEAHIEHWGRDEPIHTTHINDNTLLVEVPNRFRLVPGVAKIFVETSTGISETIDMPIEYPAPRLDAVNPNLWAADPDLAVLPISVIDAKSFAGNDTYIARRDYYILMRDELWNSQTAGETANVYFPDFDFNQMPGFPAVLWGPEQPECRGGASSGQPCSIDADCSGGMCAEMLPLPRFVQPVDNGIHNVRLAEHQYDRPQLVPVRICNPGPGGGKSNVLELMIAAPVPVTTHIDPSELSPVDIEFADDHFDEFDTPVAQPVELRIHGPRHVPTFPGYEEPKYGNFNADSKVQFDGVELPTTFTASFLLTADLPPEMVTLGDHYITVVTPDNGTEYFEEQWVNSTCTGNLTCNGGPDDGQPCVDLFDCDGVLCVGAPCFEDTDCPSGTCEPATAPYFQGRKPSGGESAPILFRIAYRRPDITALSPVGAEVGSAAFSDLTFSGTMVCVDGAMDGERCAVNEDCPDGSCDLVPTLSCVGGDNDGLACSANADCPGGGCDPVDAPQYNMSLIGTDFREGAKVFFNGRLRDSLFVNSQTVRVKLLPEDVAEVGLFPVTVKNPAPDFQEAAPQYFEVAAPAQPPSASASSGRLRVLSGLKIFGPTDR